VAVTLVLVLLAAGCGGETAPSASAHPGETEAASVEAPSLPLEAARPAPDPAAPHREVIVVADVVQVASSEAGQRVLAVLLRGDVGTSAVFRSLEIRTWTEAVDGSTCGSPPTPMILRPGHVDAVQPVLADQTRTIAVRSQGHPRGDPGAQPPAKFRYGPVPSLNGAFEGWVSFHVPVHSDEGFCAFDLRGVVVTVAGETTMAELLDIRIDTRDRLDGS
jgi:hypothetical protein